MEPQQTKLRTFLGIIEHDLNTNLIEIGINVNQEYKDSIVLTFTSIILNSANIAIGIKLKSKNKRATPWWNKDCYKAIKKY